MLARLSQKARAVIQVIRSGDWLKRGQAFIEQIFDAFFDPLVESNIRWVGWLWIAGLFLVGIVFWGKFLNWGNIPFDYHDWAEINAARIEFVRNAVRSGQLPLHMSEIGHLRNLTDRYLSIPDTITDPQMILLLFLQTGQYIFVNTLILFAAAMAALLQFRKRYSLSLVSFTWVFLLFNFNGYLTAHYGVGHVTWWVYFLLPWFLLLIFEAAERDQGWRWIAGMAFLLFMFFMEGGSHFYTWQLTFLALFGLTSWKRFWLAVKAGAAALLLTMVRLLPPALLLDKFDTEFLGGYPSIQEIFKAMTTLVPASQSMPVLGVVGASRLGWWEFDLYIGLVATIFLLYFGLVRWLKEMDAYQPLHSLLLPTIATFIFSVGDIYSYVRRIPVPLLFGERVSARMIIIPFVVILLMAGIFFQRTLSSARQSRPFRAVTFVLLLVTVYDLFQHFLAWRVTTAVKAFAYTPVDLSIKVVGNHPDPPYIHMILIGALISLATGIFLVYKAVRDRPNKGTLAT